MAIGVVDGLEAANVDDRDGQRLAALAERLVEDLGEDAAIGQFGQGVVAGQVLQAPGDGLALGDVLEGDQKAVAGHAATLHFHDLTLADLLDMRRRVVGRDTAGQPRIGEEVAGVGARRMVAEEFGEGLVAQDHALLAVQHAERLGHVVQGRGQLVLLRVEPSGHQVDLVEHHGLELLAVLLHLPQGIEDVAHLARAAGLDHVALDAAGQVAGKTRHPAQRGADGARQEDGKARHADEDRSQAGEIAQPRTLDGADRRGLGLHQVGVHRRDRAVENQRSAGDLASRHAG